MQLNAIAKNLKQRNIPHVEKQRLRSVGDAEGQYVTSFGVCCIRLKQLRYSNILFAFISVYGTNKKIKDTQAT